MRFCRFVLLVAIPWLLCQTLGLSSDLPYKMLGGKTRIEVPFEYLNGYIIVKLKLGNIIELDCIFDTGAEHTVLFDDLYAHLLRLPISDTVNIAGTDLDKLLTATICRNTPTSIGNSAMVAHDLLFLDDDIYDLRALLGHNVDGILGMSYFRNLCISIDYRKRRLIVIDPLEVNTFVKAKHHRQAIEVFNNKPYINIPFGESLSTKLLLDTGAKLSLINYLDSDATIPTTFISGVFGRGLSGDIEGFVGITSNFQLFGQTFESVVTNYQIKTEQHKYLVPGSVDKDGIIGNTILSQFDILLDFHNGRLYTKPNKYFSKKARYNKAGIELYSYGTNLNKYFVNTVNHKSPAALAGIMEQDILLSLNGVPARFRSMAAYQRKFSKKRDKLLRLGLLRNGQKQIVKIRLADYLHGTSID